MQKMKRCAWACARFSWRHGFKYQYDRRGLLHALWHTMIILSSVVTLAALTYPVLHLWGTAALWWTITLAYGITLKYWQHLRQHKRRLPRRRKWYQLS